MSPPSAFELTVATYNLYLGADLLMVLEEPDPNRRDADLAEVRRQLETTAFPRRCAAVADLVARERPDLLGVQELCTWSVDGRALWDYRTLLLAALEERGTAYDLVSCVDTFHGEGTLPWAGRPSRLRLVAANAVLRRRDSAVRVTGAGSGRFRAALVTAPAADLRVSVDRGWCTAHVTLGEEGRRLTVVVTHTEAYDPVARDRQVEELVGVLPAGPVVVLADLNATPEELRLPEGFVDAWPAAGNSGDAVAAATCGQAADLSNPVSSLADRIDYVLVRGLGVAGCSRFGADPADRGAPGLWPSDHAGVCATLRA